MQSSRALVQISFALELGLSWASLGLFWDLLALRGLVLSLPLASLGSSGVFDLYGASLELSLGLSWAVLGYLGPVLGYLGPVSRPCLGKCLVHTPVWIQRNSYLQRPDRVWAKSYYPPCLPPSPDLVWGK